LDSRLRSWRQGADLDEAETEAEHLPPDLGILVEAGGKSDRIGKAQACQLNLQPWIRLRRPSAAAV
jgi:hypothetical protein